MRSFRSITTLAVLALEVALAACSGDPQSLAPTSAASGAPSSEPASNAVRAEDPSGTDAAATDGVSQILAPTDATSRRFALVFGNSQYRHGDALPAAARDAALMANALRGRGYHVLLARDRTLAGMKEDIGVFTELSENADVRVIYFAGHGFEFGHDNYLMPVDLPSPITELDERLVGLHALRLQEVAWPMEQEAGVLVAIIDACRVGAARGATSRLTLASAEPPQGTILAYATSPGTTAADSLKAYGVDADHSPYAYFLADALSDPGLERWDQALLSAAAIVRTQTGGVQVPWMNATVTRFPDLGELESGPVKATAGPVEDLVRSISPERMAANRYWSNLEMRVATQARNRLVFDDELQQAAKQGDKEAALVLAYRWTDVPGREKEAIALLEPLAEDGNAVAQLTLGTTLYAMTTRDSQGRKATYWWQMASANGMGEARAKLALAEGRADINVLNEFAKGLVEMHGGNTGTDGPKGDQEKE